MEIPRERLTPWFCETASLAAAVQTLCERPPWCITGVSALLHDEVGLWLELTKPKHWRMRPDGAVEIGLGAIGGSLEAYETVPACLQRECREEIGQAVAPYGAAETVVVYEQRTIRRVAAAAESLPAPALLTVSANLHGQAWLPGCPTLAIVTYWARLERAPERGDLFGLVRIPWQELKSLLAPETAPWEDAAPRRHAAGAHRGAARVGCRAAGVDGPLPQLALQRAALALRAG